MHARCAADDGSITAYAETAEYSSYRNKHQAHIQNRCLDTGGEEAGVMQWEGRVSQRPKCKASCITLNRKLRTALALLVF